MLILDDMQALNVVPKVQQGMLLNLVRTAVSRYDLQVVLIGSPKLRPLLMTDDQLAERALIIEDQPFKAADPALTAFLEAFTWWCPLQRRSDLCDDAGLRKALIYRTNGITRNLMDVLTRLASYAIQSAEERITYSLWREYFARAEYD